MAFWCPVTTAAVWDVELSFIGLVMTWLYTMGWILILLQTFTVDHFELLGVKQVCEWGSE